MTKFKVLSVNTPTPPCEVHFTLEPYCGHIRLVACDSSGKRFGVILAILENGELILKNIEKSAIPGIKTCEGKIKVHKSY